MWFNNYIYKRAKATVCCFSPLLFLSLLWNSTSCNRTLSNIVPCDTIVIKHNIGRIRSFYSKEEKEQVNIYYYKNNSGRVVLNYCVGSLAPKTTFTLDNSFSNVIVENESNILVQFSSDPFFCRINNKSIIIDTVHMNMRQENGELFTINTTPYFCYIPIKKDSGTLFCESFLVSESNYAINPSSRKKMFSRPIYTKFSIGKQALSQQEGVGKFPETHLREDSTYYKYWYWVAPNKKLELATLFWFIDSIYVVDTKTGNQSSYYFRSKYQHHVNHTIDTSKIFDYNYLSKMGCESTSYMYLRYDSYREYYYIVVSRAMSAENEDGTRNSAADKPWSLIVLDKEFHQIGEIDMPKQYSKHDLMVVPEGIAIKDLSISSDKLSSFVICKLL